MNFRSRLPEQSLAIPMAPMLDIMFLLLIFFMVTLISAKLESKIGITVPSVNNSEIGNRHRNELLINLDKDGKLYINSIHKSPEYLRSLLKKVLADEGPLKKIPIIIRADRHTPHWATLQVIDICRDAGIWHIYFAALTKEERAP